MADRSGSAGPGGRLPGAGYDLSAGLTFDLGGFMKRIRALLAEKTSVVVAVSEGIRLEDGRYVCELGQTADFVDAFGHKQLTGTAAYLANYIAGEVGCKTRAIELSTLQRSASHCASRVDILERPR